MSERSVMASNLRVTTAYLRAAYHRARDDGRHFDARLLAEMRTSTEFALQVLETPDYWHLQPRQARVDVPDYGAITDEQRERLEAALAPLSKLERHVLWLCLGHDVSLKAAGAALGLTEEEAQAVYDGLIPKVKAIQRNVRSTASH